MRHRRENVFFFNNQTTDLFGGIPFSAFSNGNVPAELLNLAQLDGLLTQEGRGGASTLLVQRTYQSQKEQQGHFLVFHFQVRNTSNQEIIWPLDVLSSCYTQSGQKSSIAVNNVNVWSTTFNTQCEPTTQAQVDVTLEAGEVHDIVGLISASNSGTLRQLVFAFISQSLTLPQGVEWVASWRE